MKLDPFIYLLALLLYVALIENVNPQLSRPTQTGFESKCSLETHCNILVFWDLKHSHSSYLCNLFSKHFLSNEI